MRRFAMVLSAATMLVTVSMTDAQQGPGGGGGPPDGGPPDPSEMRAMMDRRVKKALGVTDETWATLEPLVDKVHELQHDVEGGAMMHPGPPRHEDQDNNDPNGGGGGGGGGAGGGGPDDDDHPKSPIESAVSDLKKVLSDPAAADDKIDTAVKAVEDAKTKAKADLADAQKQLAAAVKHRQQAVLIALGLLD